MVIHMSTQDTAQSALRKPLRLWPGIALAVLLLLVKFAVPMALPDEGIIGMLGAVLCGAVIGVWWLLFSRAPWVERIGTIALMIAAVFLTVRIVHPSIANAGMGMMLPMFSIPVLGVALVAALAATRGLSSGSRRAAIAAAILVGCGAFTAIRTGGITGDGASDLHWRWTRTPEELLLARAGNESFELDSAGKTRPAPATTVTPVGTPLQFDPAKPIEPAPRSGLIRAGSTKDPAAVPAAMPMTPARTRTRAEWPGFRGPNRDDIIPGVRINTDWSASPPVEIWRRPVGPGWSSFAVHGDVLYTQEQRGDDEIVAAYSVKTGAPVWRHSDRVRFWESNGGAGPRATPTPSDGRVYTLGATGVLNALNASNGTVVWSRNLASDTNKKVPGWGFASSPLVADDVVIVAATGTLVAYDAATGKPRWFGPSHKGGYSSPHRATIDGVEQILLMTADGVLSVAPADGKLLWEHAWPGVPIIQPAVAPDGDVLISTGDSMGATGIRRVAVAHRSGQWTAEERWTSSGLKPYFNDFVIHKGHVFGFDNSILACIDLADGTRKWKGGRYGHGQLMLLPDQDVLLVLSEEGELVLVAATPEKFTELARFPALEGKTWNHPVLVGDVLLVRNDHEMAAFRVTLAGR
jgi:outer membrane protein assembly factor BamB